MYVEIEELVRQCKADGASDLHVICNLPPRYRKDGEVIDMPGRETFSAEDCLRLAREMSGDFFGELDSVGELDMAETYADNRCRIHFFKQQGVPSLALRILREEIPDLTKLGLPPAALELPTLQKGIVLVTGETGSGKSTSLAAMMDYVNRNYYKHIVTLEDPVEYIYRPDKCAVNQREVGRDTKSFASGLRATLREDPDVILIGEMRDKETIETAITAAETGHLVFGTLHTGSASDSIDRMLQVFPEGMQPQIRLQLSMVLQAVLTQQLVAKKGGGRVLACELMLVTDAIRNLIRAGDTPQIANAVATSMEIGGQTMDQALVRLIREGQITRDTAMRYAVQKDYVKRQIGAV